MKTKSLAFSLGLIFFSCSLFAQNKKDTVPMPQPKTDTVPPNKPTTDTTNVSAFTQSGHFSQKKISSIEGIVYAKFPAKEDEVTVSGK